MIGAYFVIACGVTAAMHIEMSGRYPDTWRGGTLIAGMTLILMFWPVVIVTLLTLVLCRLADR